MSRRTLEVVAVLADGQPEVDFQSRFAPRCAVQHVNLLALFVVVRAWIAGDQRLPVIHRIRRYYWIPLEPFKLHLHLHKKARSKALYITFPPSMKYYSSS